MEIVKSRYGLDRSIERIDFQRLRVMGESQFVRQSKGEDGKPEFSFLEHQEVIGKIKLEPEYE